MLKLFVNTLTADDKYSLLNRDNLLQPVQILLSQKQKTIFRLFFAFLKSTLNFENFGKKYGPHSRCISIIRDCKKGDYINVLKISFKRTVSQETW